MICQINVQTVCLGVPLYTVYKISVFIEYINMCLIKPIEFPNVRRVIQLNYGVDPYIYFVKIYGLL